MPVVTLNIRHKQPERRARHRLPLTWAVTAASDTTSRWPWSGPLGKANGTECHRVGLRYLACLLAKTITSTLSPATTCASEAHAAPLKGPTMAVRVTI